MQALRREQYNVTGLALGVDFALAGWAKPGTGGLRPLRTPEQSNTIRRDKPTPTIQGDGYDRVDSYRLRSLPRRAAMTERALIRAQVGPPLLPCRTDARTARLYYAFFDARIRLSV